MATHKSPKIAKLVAHLKDGRYDARYFGFFECFNAGMHYEAHDVLEDLWLESKGDSYHFYKGLIQLAGAFVHLKNKKYRPACRLFALSKNYLLPFVPERDGLNVEELIKRIDGWLDVIKSSQYTRCPYDPAHPPRITLHP